ncbi:MAG TPA: hypothetical protein VGI74_17125, partial [Streptosporangiaceae bacterium]
RTAGFLVNAVQPDAVRLAPPLILSSAQAELFTRTLPAILDVVADAEMAGDHWFVSRPAPARSAAQRIRKELGL